MHEVEIDVEHARPVRLTVNDVVIENLVIKGLWSAACHRGSSLAAPARLVTKPSS
jgi:hypothetical protein